MKIEIEITREKLVDLARSNLGTLALLAIVPLAFTAGIGIGYRQGNAVIKYETKKAYEEGYWKAQAEHGVYEHSDAYENWAPELRAILDSSRAEAPYVAKYKDGVDHMPPRPSPWKDRLVAVWHFFFPPAPIYGSPEWFASLSDDQRIAYSRTVAASSHADALEEQAQAFVEQAEAIREAGETQAQAINEAADRKAEAILSAASDLSHTRREAAEEQVLAMLEAAQFQADAIRDAAEEQADMLREHGQAIAQSNWDAARLRAAALLDAADIQASAVRQGAGYVADAYQQGSQVQAAAIHGAGRDQSRAIQDLADRPINVNVEVYGERFR